MSGSRREAPRHWQRMLLWTVTLVLCWSVGPFVSAGTWRWGQCWLYFAVLAAGLLAHRRYVARKNPELLARRQRIGEGTPRWDVVWNLLFWPQMVAVPLVAGLGIRLGWAVAPLPVFPAGVALFAAGLVLSGRAMAVNPHFEGTVRIQRERDHRVVETGPYRVLRHPGYAGLVLWALAGPLVLRSWEALEPAATVALWIVLRTGLEDSFLRRELPGYAAYATRVRWRLLPGVW